MDLKTCLFVKLFGPRTSLGRPLLISRSLVRIIRYVWRGFRKLRKTDFFSKFKYRQFSQPLCSCQLDATSELLGLEFHE